MLIDLLIRALAPLLVQIFMKLIGMQARGEIHEVNEETMVAALKEHRQEIRHAMRSFGGFKGAE
jgi:hypothetical protein